MAPMQVNTNRATVLGFVTSTYFQTRAPQLFAASTELKRAVLVDSSSIAAYLLDAAIIAEKHWRVNCGTASVVLGVF
jgi:hypothetical protein